MSCCSIKTFLLRSEVYAEDCLPFDSHSGGVPVYRGNHIWTGQWSQRRQEAVRLGNVWRQRPDMQDLSQRNDWHPFTAGRATTVQDTPERSAISRRWKR